MLLDLSFHFWNVNSIHLYFVQARPNCTTLTYRNFVDTLYKCSLNLNLNRPCRRLTKVKRSKVKIARSHNAWAAGSMMLLQSDFIVLDQRFYHQHDSVLKWFFIQRLQPMPVQYMFRWESESVTAVRTRRRRCVSCVMLRVTHYQHDTTTLYSPIRMHSSSLR